MAETKEIFYFDEWTIVEYRRFQQIKDGSWLALQPESRDCQVYVDRNGINRCVILDGKRYPLMPRPKGSEVIKGISRMSGGQLGNVTEYVEHYIPYKNDDS